MHRMAMMQQSGEVAPEVDVYSLCRFNRLYTFVHI